MTKIFIADIDYDELACIISEAVIGVKRKPGSSAKESMIEMAGHNSDCTNGFYKAADDVVKYFYEQINSAKMVENNDRDLH